MVGAYKQPAINWGSSPQMDAWWRQMGQQHPAANGGNPFGASQAPPRAAQAPVGTISWDGSAPQQASGASASSPFWSAYQQWQQAQAQQAPSPGGGVAPPIQPIPPGRPLNPPLSPYPPGPPTGGPLPPAIPPGRPLNPPTGVTGDKSLTTAPVSLQQSYTQQQAGYAAAQQQSSQQANWGAWGLGPAAPAAATPLPGSDGKPVSGVSSNAGDYAGRGAPAVDGQGGHWQYPGDGTAIWVPDASTSQQGSYKGQGTPATNGHWQTQGDGSAIWVPDTTASTPATVGASQGNTTSTATPAYDPNSASAGTMLSPQGRLLGSTANPSGLTDDMRVYYTSVDPRSYMQQWVASQADPNSDKGRYMLSQYAATWAAYLKAAQGNDNLLFPDFLATYGPTLTASYGSMGFDDRGEAPPTLNSGRIVW